VSPALKLIDRPFRITAARLALAAVLALGVASCASNENKVVDEIADAPPPEQLYNEGLAFIQAGRYSKANEQFEKVDRLHPYSEWARKAMLMQAYSNYQVGAYQETINAARRFVTLYPASEDAPYALFLVGESYFKQIPDVTRDQDITNKAMLAYAEIVQRYPESRYAEEAKKRLDIGKDQVAGKEMEVGRFYLAQRQYLAAINRFKVVAQEHQRTRHVEEALARLTECYYALGVVKEAQTAAAVLGYNFPDSRWYKDSFSLLKSGGYEPSEDQDSWISRAFKGFRVL
jgi:outer membrane protein assembly factor BamD